MMKSLARFLRTSVKLAGDQTLHVGKAKVDLRTRDCLVGYKAQLLTGCQFRGQHLR